MGATARQLGGSLFLVFHPECDASCAGMSETEKAAENSPGERTVSPREISSGPQILIFPPTCCGRHGRNQDGIMLIWLIG